VEPLELGGVTTEVLKQVVTPDLFSLVPEADTWLVLALVAVLLRERIGLEGNFALLPQPTAAVSTVGSTHKESAASQAHLYQKPLQQLVGWKQAQQRQQRKAELRQRCSGWWHNAGMRNST
jgi:hypothetical protein